MSISQRVKEICDFEGSQSKFAQKTGLKTQTVSKMIREDAGMRSDTLLSIHTAYPTLNIHWLITGEGEMWIGDPPGGQYPENDQVSMVNEPEPVNEEGLTAKEEALALKLVEALEKRIKLMERQIAKADPELAREMGIDVEGE